MKDSVRLRNVLPGAHRVRVTLARGRVGEYWYASRGGPRILHATAASDAALAREVDRLTPEAIKQFQALSGRSPSRQFIPGLIALYLDSPEFAKLAARTKKDLRRALDVARIDLAELEVKALEGAGVRRDLLAWRDGYADHPKTADGYLGALALVIGWAHKRGEIPAHPLQNWPRIYTVDRADVIWTKPDLIKLLKGADPDFRRAVLVATFTGLRLGDLVRLTWADVGADAITLATSKSRGKRVAIIPITPKLSAVLKQIGRKDVGAVLTHSRGKPWTGWGVQTAMQRAKTERGIKGLRLHDLRGTAATHLVRCGLPLADVASALGWAPAKVEAIARRYVNAEAIAAGMLARIRQNKAGGRL